MVLLDFINSNSNWREKLSSAPYNIKIKDEGAYSILSYDMLSSNMNLEIVKQCRGTIVKKTDNGYKCVCYPFRKFGNFSESYADTNFIDWSLGVDVQSKIDGSLIKAFNDEGVWLVATNNTINAFSAPCDDSTFGDVFFSIIEKHIRIKDFFAALDPNFTYMFEMVHPFYNPIVIHYDKPAIYFLGRRDMRTFEEDTKRNEFYSMDWICFPAHNHYNSLYECIEAAHHMGKDEEGYVVTAINQRATDGSFLRVKVKGEKYLELHRLRGNGPLTATKIIELYQTDSLDDFIAYYPEFKSFVDEVIGQIRHLIDISDIAFKTIMSYVNDNPNNRRTFARYACSYISPLKSFLFARLDKKVENATEFYKGMRAKSLSTHLQSILNIKEVGVKEDE